MLSPRFDNLFESLTPTKLVGMIGALILITGLVLMFVETFAGYLVGLGGVLLVFWTFLLSE